MRVSSFTLAVAFALAMLLVLPTAGWTGQQGKQGVDIEKALNPIGLSTDTMKAERFQEENKAKVSTDFFEAIRDLWVGLLHPAKFGKEVATLEAKPVSAAPAKQGVDIEKALNPVGLSTDTMKAEQFKEENKAKVSTDFFEAIRDLWIGLLHPAQFGADMARMPKSK